MPAVDVPGVARSLPEATEVEPFGPGTLVFKVAGKVFAIHQTQAEPAQVTLKCEPGLALELRAQYEAVTPGYHVNKRLWNTIVLDGTVPADEVAELVRHSWEQAVGGLRKADRERLLPLLG